MFEQAPSNSSDYSKGQEIAKMETVQEVVAKCSNCFVIYPSETAKSELEYHCIFNDVKNCAFHEVDERTIVDAILAETKTKTPVDSTPKPSKLQCFLCFTSGSLALKIWSSLPRIPIYFLQNEGVLSKIEKDKVTTVSNNDTGDRRIALLETLKRQSVKEFRQLNKVPIDDQNIRQKTSIPSLEHIIDELDNQIRLLVVTQEGLEEAFDDDIDIQLIYYENYLAAQAKFARIAELEEEILRRGGGACVKRVLQKQKKRKEAKIETLNRLNAKTDFPKETNESGVFL
eukprot:g2819.t1